MIQRPSDGSDSAFGAQDLGRHYGRNEKLLPRDLKAVSSSKVDNSGQEHGTGLLFSFVFVLVDSGVPRRVIEWPWFGGERRMLIHRENGEMSMTSHAIL
jgi:hypothetical protein